MACHQFLPANLLVMLGIRGTAPLLCRRACCTLDVLSTAAGTCQISIKCCSHFAALPTSNFQSDGEIQQPKMSRIVPKPARRTSPHLALRGEAILYPMMGRWMALETPEAPP